MVPLKHRMTCENELCYVAVKRLDRFRTRSAHHLRPLLSRLYILHEIGSNKHFADEVIARETIVVHNSHYEMAIL